MHDINMTSKEFEEILDKVGINFKIYGYAGILNKVAICENAMANDEADRNCETLEKMYRGYANAIHDELTRRGYY